LAAEVIEEPGKTWTNGVMRRNVIVLLLVWAASIGYIGARIKTSWVPFDEGTLGLSAERVLQGQMPHRDFDDYTGGLTYLHALAFRVFGISSAAMRFTLLLFSIAWVPAIFYIASRFGSAGAAGAVTLLAVAWSVPNYPGPMPSWYNLFFATFGTAALLRYLEVHARRWLVIAGLCAGLSALAKVIAAYFIAAALLFFIFREQEIAKDRNRSAVARAHFYRATTAVGLAVFLVLLFRMIRAVPGANELIYFVLPATGLTALIIAREYEGIAGTDRERFASFLNMCLPFLAGASIPVALFLVPYIRAGVVHDLIRGLLATPARAILFTFFASRSPLTMVAIIPFAVALVTAYECRKIGRAICGSVMAVYGSLILIFAGRSTAAYGLGWCSLGTSIPALTLAGAAVLWFSRANEMLSSLRKQQLMLVLCVSCLCSLVQFPVAAPVYFLFIAPLVLLSAMALVTSVGRPGVLVPGVLIAFYLVFACLPVGAYEIALRKTRDARTIRLNIPRAGGLQVDATDAGVYDELIPLVQAHANGGFIYAAPDCPEVYFFSGSKSLSRHYFGYAENLPNQSAWVLKQIETLRVNVVAINHNPRFSETISPDLLIALKERFPESTNLGNFEVRWKE